MTKVITLRKKRNSYIQSERKKKSLPSEFLIQKDRILLTIASVISLLTGSLIYRFIPNADITAEINSSLNLLCSAEYPEIFLYFLQSDLLFIFVSYFIGTSFAGTLLSSLPLVLKCIFIGYQSGYLYNEFELKGVLFALVLLFPCYIITTASLIFAADESIYMSKYLFNTITNKNTANDISVKLYLLRYLILVIINIVCIAVNSVIVGFIAPKINLF